MQLGCRLYGDYESLTHGYTADALVDFTGGVAERLECKAFAVEDQEGRESLFQTLHQANDSKSLLVCCKEVWYACFFFATIYQIINLDEVETKQKTAILLY